MKELCELVELVLVIGASNSSNCIRLREVAEAQGKPAYLINGPKELEPDWLVGVGSVGITSGASTPETLVHEVVDVIAPDEVHHVQTIEEDVSFVLPRALR